MRRRRPEKRKIVPDPIYGDLVVAKFVNNLMKGGKKSIAEKIFYQCLSLIEKKEKKDKSIDVFKKALKNASPVVEVKSKRIGGATYQVPIEIPENRRLALAMRWIISFARSKKGNSMVDKLASELIAAYNNDGSTIKKKEDTHKMAEANKAFAHFR
ncbi:MAG: 30S ribosomal protein S7 [Candidatus Marinimicrobia bacterium]|nr:30S ribosomal protein S7 [Candidatus Neomarinimicrobiota bacterium]|tara:strand:+ start:8785 stop:9252 length:468 start_codon:yes stop_codon:yes gene_type:complete